MKNSKRTLANIFGAALTWHGWRSLPITPMLVWAGLVVAKRRDSFHKRWHKILGLSALQTVLLFGSEWLHNLAHAAAAAWVGKPADEIRIMFGMPRLIYREINDTSVTPQQHVARAVGGPLFNSLLAGGLWLARRNTALQPEANVHTLIESTLKMNVFLATVAWLPIPGIDGGAALKWLLVARGYSIPQADATVQRVNLLTAPLTIATGGLLLRKRHTWAGALAAVLGGIMFAVGMGWLREQNIIEKLDR